MNPLLSKEDLLYLAGFLDGDGSIIAQLVRRKDYVNKFQIRLTVQFTQLTKRRHHLEDIKKIIGAGTLRDTDKNVSHYVLTDTKEVHKFLQQMAPYLRIKKKQAYLTIRIIEELPSARQSVETFVELCKMVDQVAELNDSKKKTIDARIVAKELLNSEI
jgi:hypothetical protein